MTTQVALLNTVSKGFQCYLQDFVYQEMFQENQQLKSKVGQLQMQLGKYELQERLRDEYGSDPFLTTGEVALNLADRRQDQITPVSDHLCMYLRTQDRVVKLRIVSHHTTDLGLQAICQMPKLRYLVIELSNITLNGFRTIGSLQNLEALGGYCLANLLTDSSQIKHQELFFKGLDSLPKLKRLNLGLQTHLDSIDRNFYESLVRLCKCGNLCKQLIELILYNWIIPKEIVQEGHLSQLESVEILDLSYTNINTEKLNCVFRQADYQIPVTYLGIRGTQVDSGIVSRTLIHLHTLRSLDINRGQWKETDINVLKSRLPQVSVYLGKNPDSPNYQNRSYSDSSDSDPET